MASYRVKQDAVGGAAMRPTPPEFGVTRSRNCSMEEKGNFRSVYQSSPVRPVIETALQRKTTAKSTASFHTTNYSEKF